MVVTPRCFSDTHQPCHPLGTLMAAASKCQLAKHNQRTQCTLGKIVCRGNPSNAIERMISMLVQVLDSAGG
jgi:hypothetical protein